MNGFCFVLLNLGYIKSAGLGDRLSMDGQGKRGTRNNFQVAGLRKYIGDGAIS